MGVSENAQNSITILDCTLRDGGYINNWEFGRENIKSILKGLITSGVNLIELGFMRNEPTNEERTIFSSIEAMNTMTTSLISHQQIMNEEIKYSAMIEAFNPFPLNMLSTRDSSHSNRGVQLIRVCIWKRCMAEHLSYCKSIIDKGYTISIQPSRVEQYSDIEFTEMLKHVNDFHPFSVYIVDTWGTQEAAQIKHYVEIAEKHLDANIKIGYHGHNNKMQALSCAEAFISMQLTHDKCIDSSIMGMGRGAGNLNTEIIMDFMNKYYGTTYNINAILTAYYDALSQVFQTTHWGYDMYHFLCASYNSNPNFATYFKENGYNELRLAKFLSALKEDEKILVSRDFVEAKLSELGM